MIVAMKSDSMQAILTPVAEYAGSPETRGIIVVCFRKDNTNSLRAVGTFNPAELALMGAWFLAEANRMTDTKGDRP